MQGPPPRENVHTKRALWPTRAYGRRRRMHPNVLRPNTSLGYVSSVGDQRKKQDGPKRYFGGTGGGGGRGGAEEWINGRGEVQATVAIIAWLPIGSAWLALARATNGSKTYRDKQKKRRLGPPRARPRPGGRATPARAARQPSHGHAALRGARGAPRRQALVGGVPGKARKKLLGRPQAS
ncbi:unnamed protein product [Prorocentrum cordatum]|uniref:Uncharacterized protein n=1 Tax=Prorocentrum cordatum TaxID=2364126 RepID=A0ABN9QIZ4_9DINO|nr:unnamed protein product [Polarella glacialis]